ncbi:hypothetical protein [Endozoicomonas sp.]
MIYEKLGIDKKAITEKSREGAGPNDFERKSLSAERQLEYAPEYHQT